MPQLTRPDGVELSWEGTGEGELVVLLHGLSSTAKSFRHQLMGLGRDHRVVALDMRGYGASADWSTPPALDDLVEDVAAVIGIEGGPAHLVGSSFGSLVALALARRHPSCVRSLSLASPTLGRGGLPPAQRTAWKLDRLSAATGVEGAEERAAALAAAGAGARVIGEIAESVARVRARAYRRVVELVAEIDGAPWLGDVRQPVLAIAGRNDRVTGVPVLERVSRLCPLARIVVVPNAGHAVHLESPALFNAALSSFIREVEGEPPLRIGICGTGSIARTVLAGVALGLAGPARVVAAAGRPGHVASIRQLAEEFGFSPTVDPAALPRLGAEVILEAAGLDAARASVEKWIAGGADVVLMSSAALADPGFECRVRRALQRHHRRLYVPPGAVGGVDALFAASLGTLQEVNLRTTKPAGAIDTPDPTGLVYSGNAKGAADRFPRNMNVAATLQAAAGIDVNVEVIADEAATRNQHRVVATGDFGRLEVIVDNFPSPDNSRTSRLAALSALATLRKLREPLVVGA